MGQKINPISLRLQSQTRDFDNCWYSDYFYARLLSKDFYLQHYFNNFLKLYKLPASRFSIQYLPKQIRIYTFLCYPKSSRFTRSRMFGVAGGLKKRTLKKYKQGQKTKLLFFHSQKHNFWNTNSIAKKFIFNKSFDTKLNIFKNKVLFLHTLISLYSIYNQNIQKNVINVKKNLQKENYRGYIQRYISRILSTECTSLSFKVKQDWQNAGFLADEIVYFLEKRVAFRRIKTKIIQHLTQNSNIQGLRITCSGRVGGKSKKAQRAKTECVKYGQTSLHVFSNPIDFASRTAFTVFGSVGVKVWISYKTL